MRTPSASFGHACVALVLLVALGAGVAHAGTPTSPAVPPGAITATAASTFFPSLTDAFLTIDESGLTGDLHDAHPQGHTMWLSQSGGGGSVGNNPAGVAGATWLDYDLGQLYDLEELWIWNHNQAGLTDRGLRDIAVHTSTDGAAWTFLGNYTLAQAPGTDNYAHGNEIVFGGANARYVLLTAAETNGNYGSAYYGLSEVRFYGDALGCIPSDYPVQLDSASVATDFDGMLVPQTVGWLGSDIAHSIPISSTQTVWLFGDTFIGTSSGGQRDGGATFINNSIGIEDRTMSPPGNVAFHWGAGNTSFFPHQPGTPGIFYWPTEGIMLGGELFVFCYSVGSGLTLPGTTLIRVPNPTDPPSMWTQNAFDFGIGADLRFYHSAVYVEEPYVYLMGSNDPGGNVALRHMILARMATADLLAGSLGEAAEFWVDIGAGPEWSDMPDNPVSLFAPGVSETDIQYDATFGLYFCTTYDVFGPTIYITTAPALTGPWSDPVCVFDVPEHATTPFSIISYAVRPHPEYSTQPGEVVLTYATNELGGLANLFTPDGFGIYHPRFVRLQFSEAVPVVVSALRLY